VFSALCILGTAEPCFESAMIGRQFELNQFKKEFQLMMEEYKRVNTESSSVTAAAETPSVAAEDAVLTNDGGDAPEDSNNHNHNKEEDVQLGKIIFSEVCAKVNSLLAEHVFRYRTGKQYDKYVIISINETDKAVVVIDREDRYSVSKIPYVATQTKEGLVVNLDYENKTAMGFGVTDKPESAFSVIEEVEMIAKDASAYDVEQYSNIKINELNAKLENVTAQFETAQAKVTELENHLEVFQKEKKLYMEQKHKDIIDALVASRRDEMGKFSEYLDYCIKIDYCKTVEQVEKDIKEIHYNFMLRNSKSGGKKNFSAIEADVAGNPGAEANSIAERYGEDIAKYFK
jgi:hypothetical protein